MKIGCIIPIRLSSERLPGKAILEGVDKPMVCHLLDQVFAAKHIEKNIDVVVCTTCDEADDPLAEIVTSYGASIFRGSRDDLIKRFHDAVIQFGFDAIIQVDGDDILCSTEYMDTTMDHLLANKHLDVVSVAGLPLGCASKSFTAAALNKVYQNYQTQENDTGFGYFFTKSGICAHEEIKVSDPSHIYDSVRLTLDYEDDLIVFRNILKALYKDECGIKLADVVSYLVSNPEVAQISLHLNEQYWSRTSDKVCLEYIDEKGHLQQITLN